MKNVVLPAVQNENGHLFVTSQNIAEVFEKRHSHVIRDIKNIIEGLDEARRVNFEEATVIQQVGSVQRAMTIYKLSRDGLVFLIMGYTGKNAQKFKWAYIDEFNRMEQVLRGQYVLPRKTITVEQQQAIRKAISMRCKNIHASYKTVYTALYEEFQIPRYTELLQSDFEKAVAFIDNLDLKVPALRKNGFSVPDGHLLLDPIHVEQLRISVYYYTVIMRDVFNVAHQVLSTCKSPYAGRMYEANCCGPIYGLRQLLENHGIDVQTPRLAR